MFAKALPHLFVPHYEDFFVSSSDSYQSKALKLEILSSIVTESSISSVFKEFQVIFSVFMVFFLITLKSWLPYVWISSFWELLVTYIHTCECLYAYKSVSCLLINS